MASPPTSPGTLPKAALYYATGNTGSNVARLALREKGYGDDEVDLRIVDVSKGENFTLSYLRLNPKATVPTLVVPIQSTLSQDVESKYKSVTDPVAIACFLDSSRSGISKTRSTSQRPAPSLSPATPDFSVAQKRIMGEMLLPFAPISPDKTPSAEHDPIPSPKFDQDDIALYNAAPGQKNSLPNLAKELKSTLEDRRSTLVGLLKSVQNQPTLPESERPRASEKVKTLWKSNLDTVELVLSVFSHADVPDADLKEESLKASRLAYYDEAGRVWAGVAERLKRINKEAVGPMMFGDQLSLADLVAHAYLARLAILAGVDASAVSGTALIEGIEAYINAFVIPTLKLKFQLPRNYDANDAIHLEGEDNITPKEKSKEDAELKGKDASASTERRTKLSVLWDTLKARESWEANLKLALGQV
jgi:glutathione S-transferase